MRISNTKGSSTHEEGLASDTILYGHASGNGVNMGVILFGSDLSFYGSGYASGSGLYAGMGCSVGGEATDICKL